MADDAPGIEVHWNQDDTSKNPTIEFAREVEWKLDFSSSDTSLKALQEKVALQAIQQAMDRFEGNVDRVAGFLEMSRRSVYRYLERGKKDQLEA